LRRPGAAGRGVPGPSATPTCSPRSTPPTVTSQSLRADLAAAQERASRQAARICQLEHKLSELPGQQAWRDSRFGAPADIDALNQKITHLEQHVTDLRLQLERKDEDMQAARAANRELMTQLNATAPAPQ
jgi:chromosome segregation ATPase